MVAKAAAASKYREKCKKPKKSILTVNPEESLPRHVPLFRLENSRSCRFLPDLDPQLLSLGKTPYESESGRVGTHGMERKTNNQKKAFKKLRGYSQLPLL
jgi:hypothetical protein